MSRHPFFRSRLFIVPALLLVVAAGTLAEPTPKTPPPHLAVAEALVTDLAGASENVYGGGRRHIDWDAGHCAARTVCSSFVTLLFQHTYHWTTSDIKAWLGLDDPEASDYHDAITAHNGFLRIVHVRALRPGDILAVKYTDYHRSRNGVEDTGHVLLVDAAPQPVAPEPPLEPGTQQYRVTVIDSSASGHGPTDSRHTPDGTLTGGIGRGVFRLYADSDDHIAGYTWSALRVSDYCTAPARDLVAGRLTRTASSP